MMLREWVIERRSFNSEEWEISTYSGQVELYVSELEAQDIVDERNRIGYKNCEWRVAHDW